MPTIVVEVMPKAELLDPQGKAVAGALARSGSRFGGVRIGKRFELSFDGNAEDTALADARALADDMLSNSVIEDVVSVRYADDGDDVDRASVSTGSGHVSATTSPGDASVISASGHASATTSVRGQYANEPGASS